MRAEAWGGPGCRTLDAPRAGKAEPREEGQSWHLRNVVGRAVSAGRRVVLRWGDTRSLPNTRTPTLSTECLSYGSGYLHFTDKKQEVRGGR